MSGRRSRLRTSVGVLAAFALAWGVSRAFASGWEAGAAGTRGAIAAPTPASYDSATRAVQGSLAPAAASAVAASMREGAGLLVVLRRVDVLTCEDLGRQLRELQSRAGDLPLVVAADTGAVAGLRAFVRRERVKAVVVEVATREVLQAVPALPTPAVLVVRDHGARVAGIAHPRRFSNARLRSFADELASQLE